MLSMFSIVDVVGVVILCVGCFIVWYSGCCVFCVGSCLGLVLVG